MYEKKDGIYYTFGYAGSGFKHLPIHGKKMYELITQQQKAKL